MKVNKKMNLWKIHGKFYDLSTFLNLHPGGKIILEQCRGEQDLTAAFESYHAMSDMNKIKKIMKKYEIKDKWYKTEFNFEKTSFYMELKAKVKKHFITNNIDHHANTFWVIKVVLQIFAYIVSFILGCYAEWIPLYARIFLNFFAGHMFIQYGFTVMHDASHHAVSCNKFTNEILASIWNSLALWNTGIWYKHHCIMHHSFTGSKKDPDTIHFKPFIRKSLQEKPTKYLKYNNYMAFISLNIIPGMWFGQAIIYLRGIMKKKILRMPITYTLKIHEVLLSMFTIFSLLYSRNVYLLFSYVIACNMTYCFCILPDHDTFETHSNIVCDTKIIDWGELQVRNSGNFATSNSLLNHCFGGINYQIEHHLFPTISHIHFPAIAKIVKKTCKEYEIPYIDHGSIYSAICSVFKNFEELSKIKTVKCN